MITAPQLTALRTPLRAGQNQVRVAGVRGSAPINLDFVQIAVI